MSSFVSFVAETGKRCITSLSAKTPSEWDMKMYLALVYKFTLLLNPSTREQPHDIYCQTVLTQLPKIINLLLKLKWQQDTFINLHR